MFEEKVVLRGDAPLFDADRALIAATFITAAAGTIKRSFTQQVSKNHLDQDGDTIIVAMPVLTLRDERCARISLTPFAPRSTRADSDPVSAQFGPGA